MYSEKEQMKAIEVSYKTNEAFYQYYMKDIGVSELCVKLRTYEEYMRKKYPEIENANLWFKFGLDDTEATTIAGVYDMLSLSHTSPNRQYLEEKIGIVTENPLDENYKLQVFFS